MWGAGEHAQDHPGRTLLIAHGLQPGMGLEMRRDREGRGEPGHHVVDLALAPRQHQSQGESQRPGAEEGSQARQIQGPWNRGAQMDDQQCDLDQHEATVGPGVEGQPAGHGQGHGRRHRPPLSLRFPTQPREQRALHAGQQQGPVQKRGVGWAQGQRGAGLGRKAGQQQDRQQQDRPDRGGGVQDPSGQGAHQPESGAGQVQQGQPPAGQEGQLGDEEQEDHAEGMRRSQSVSTPPERTRSGGIQ